MKNETKIINSFVQFVIAFSLVWAAAALLTGCTTITPDRAYSIIRGGK